MRVKGVRRARGHALWCLCWDGGCRIDDDTNDEENGICRGEMSMHHCSPVHGDEAELFIRRLGIGRR